MSKLTEAWGELRGYCLAVFLVCLLGWSLTNMDQSLFAYAIPGILVDFDSSIEDIGVLLTISFIFTAILSVIIGLFADHYGRRVMFLICLAVSALFVGMHTFVTGIVALTIVRAFAFGFSNGLAPITNAYVAEAAPARYRGMVVGLLQTGYPIGWFFASMVALPIIGALGWRYVFLPALLVVPIAFILVRRLPESRKFETVHAQEDKERAGVKRALPDFGKITEILRPPYLKRTVLCFIAFVLFGGAYAGTAFYFPTYFIEYRGYSEEMASALIGISYLIGVIGYILAAVVGEFYTTRRNTVVIWSWLGALALAGLVWLPETYIGDAIWFSLMAGFFYGNAAVIMTYVVEIFPTRVRATGAAIAGTFALNIGQATYPLLVAKGIETIGWQWAFTWAVVPSMIISGLCILGLDNIKSGVDLDEITA